MSPRGRSTVARRLARVPAVVWAATVAVGALAAAWSVVLPLGEGPDEPSHLGLVLHLADGGGYPDHDGLARSVAVVRLCATYAAAVRACPAPGEEVTADAVRMRRADDAPPRSGRPAWDDDGGDRPTEVLNHMAQHPPLYHLALAAVLRVVRMVAGGPLSLDRELALLRLVNALLVAPLPLLAWATTRRAGAGERAGRVAAVLVMGLPMLTATGAVLNNDNLLTVLGAVTTLLLVTVARGDGSRRTALVLGAVLAAALLTKAFAVVLLPAVPVAWWVGSRAGPGPPRLRQEILLGIGSRRERAVAVAAATSWTALPVVTVAGPWFLRVVARTGSPLPSVDAARYTSALAPPGFEADPSVFADRFVGLLAERFWGSFGWYTVRLPGWATVALTVVAIGLVLAGLSRSDRLDRLDRLGWGLVVVLLTPVVLLGVLIALRAWSLHARSGQYPFIQGRYLFAGVMGPLVVAARGWDRLVRGRWSLPVLSVSVVGVQAAALTLAVVGYWEGSGPGGRLAAVDAWSGWPDGVATALVALGAASLVGLVVVAVVAGRRCLVGAGPPVRSASR